MPELSHLDGRGRARMVDVGAKPATRREAVAYGEVRMGPSSSRLLKDGKVPKGDVFAVARIAGILAAKKTGELIPLCHPLSLESIEVEFKHEGDRVFIRARARLEGKTGVEMEALTAVSVAALTIYDMLKAVDRGMTLGPICLGRKSGGRGGEYVREGLPEEGTWR